MTAANITINATPGSNLDLPLGVLVQLNNVNNGGEVSYLWSIVDQPDGPVDALSSSSVQNPTFTPQKEGTYLIRLIVNQALGDEVSQQVVASVRQLKTRIRVPAAGETTEGNTQDGWAQDVNINLRRLDNVLAGAHVQTVHLDTTRTAGTVVRYTGAQTIKVGLPGEEKVPRADLAQASTLSHTQEPLALLQLAVSGAAPTGGQLCYATTKGIVDGLTIGGSPVAGASVFLTNAGGLSTTPGTNRRKVGVCLSATAIFFDGAVQEANASAVSGDISGTLPGPITVVGIRGVGMDATAPTSGQVIAFNGLTWAPTTISTTPTGSAGGDLSGTYPNPTVIALQGRAVQNFGPSAGDTLRWDAGNSWWAVVSGTSYADNVFRVYDNADATKLLAFELSGVTTGTTRTLTVPNASGTILLAPTFNAGRVVFHGAAALDDDPAFVWDDTNKRLAVGVASPAAKLHVTSASVAPADAPYLRVTGDSAGTPLDVFDVGPFARVSLRGDVSRVPLTGSEGAPLLAVYDASNARPFVGLGVAYENAFARAALSFGAAQTAAGFWESQPASFWIGQEGTSPAQLSIRAHASGPGVDAASETLDYPATRGLMYFNATGSPGVFVSGSGAAQAFAVVGASSDFYVEGTGVLRRTYARSLVADANSATLGTVAAAATLHVRGEGATSATDAVLVENSAGTDALRVRDDSLVILPQLTASRAVVTGASSELAVSAATAAEVGYLSGVTGAIQTQINGKITSPTWNTGRIMYHGAAGVADEAAFTWNPTNNILNIDGAVSTGTDTPRVRLGYTGDADATLSATAYAHDDAAIIWDGHYNGTNYIASHTSVFAAYKYGGRLSILARTGTTKGGTISWDLTGGWHFHGTGRVSLGTTTSDAKAHIRGEGATNATTALLVENSAGTDAFVVRDDGSVGVGTATPANTFVVRGAAPTISMEVTGFSHFFNNSAYTRPNQVAGISYYSGSNGGALIPGVGSGTVPGLAFFGLSGSATPSAEPVQFVATKYNGAGDTAAMGSTEKAFAFGLGAAGFNKGTEAFAIWGDGNVSIGTTGHAYRLSSRHDSNSITGLFHHNNDAGSAACAQLRMENNGSAGTFYAGIACTNYSGFAPWDGGRAYIGSNNNALSLFTQSAHDILFYTGAVEKMRYSHSTTNFLIGTTITGGPRLTVAQGSGTPFVSGTVPPGIGIEFTAADGNGAALTFCGTFNSTQGIAAIGATRTAGYNTDLRFFTNNTVGGNAFSERMRIESGGNVVIGHNAASARLHARGSGSTSATNALLLEESGGASLFQVRDDGLAILTYDGVLNGYPSALTVRTAAAGASSAATGTGVNFQMTPFGGGGSYVTAGRISVVQEVDWTSTASTQDAYMEFTVAENGTEQIGLTIKSNRNVGVGQSTANARLHVRAGSATANTAPIKLDSGAVLTTPEAGAIEYETDTFYIDPIASRREAIQGTIFTKTDTTAVANTTDETSLVGSGKGSMVLPANFAGAAGKTIRVTVRGTYSCVESSVDVRIRLGADVGTGTQVAIVSASSGNAANQPWFATFDLTFRTVGAAGTVMCHGNGFFKGADAPETKMIAPTSTTTIDTTASQTIFVTADNSVADPSIHCTAYTMTVEALN